MFEEFNLLYTLFLVALVVGAYLYLFRDPPPPQPINKVKQQTVAPTTTAEKPRVAVPPPVVVPPGTKGRIKILFGTQTGTAEDFSHTLAKEAKSYHIFAQVMDMELYDVDSLASEPYPVIIVTATHGEGEPPDNAKIMYKWLGNEASPSILEKVNYTVFGLGNKTYEHYNAVARYIDKRFKDLGAKQFYARGEGDDDCSLEEDFHKWRKNLWPALCKHMGLSADADAKVEDEKFVPRFKLVHCPPSASNKYAIRGGFKKQNSDGTPIYDIKNPYMATVVINRELHGDSSDRSCRHIEFEIGDSLHYQAGDHLGIYPENQPALVAHLAERLQADLDAVISLVPVESTLPANLSTEEEMNAAATSALVGPSTLRQILTDAIDITTPPRKAVLKALSGYATDPNEKAQLVHLSNDGEGDDYAKFIKHDQRTIYEVLQHFPSVNPPLAHLLELLPRLAPRYYSISSSPNAHPGRVHITSVVVRFHTPTGREHHGVCSTWLASLTPGTKVPAFVRESHFKLPPTPAPIVMVGPGTGVAPFRGFLQELKHRRSKGDTDYESILFFGCRHRKHDYIYEEELTGFTGDNTLSHLHVAFSREQDQKVYVQDKIGDPGTKEKLWEFLNEKKGYFYVCGDARQMAKAVHQTLINVAQECGHMSEEEATAFVDNLQKSGRYLQDVWF